MVRQLGRKLLKINRRTVISAKGVESEAKKAGYSYTDMIEKIVELARARII